MAVKLLVPFFFFAYYTFLIFFCTLNIFRDHMFNQIRVGLGINIF